MHKAHMPHAWEACAVVIDVCVRLAGWLKDGWASGRVDGLEVSNAAALPGDPVPAFPPMDAYSQAGPEVELPLGVVKHWRDTK